MTPTLWKVDAHPIVATCKYMVTGFEHKFSAPGENLQFADLGCGVGVFSEKIALQFPKARIHAIDKEFTHFGKFSPVMPANVVVHHSDITEKINLEDRSIDGVAFSMVVAELTDSEVDSVSKEISRVTKPGGQIFVAVPHPQYCAARAQKAALDPDETVDRQTVDPTYTDYERYLRGENVIPSILAKYDIVPNKIIDILGLNSKGKPNPGPTVRIYSC